MGFPRQEYWTRSPFLSPGDSHDPGIEPVTLSCLHCKQILCHWALMGGQKINYPSILKIAYLGKKKEIQREKQVSYRLQSASLSEKDLIGDDIRSSPPLSIFPCIFQQPNFGWGQNQIGLSVLVFFKLPFVPASHWGRKEHVYYYEILTPWSRENNLIFKVIFLPSLPMCRLPHKKNWQACSELGNVISGSLRGDEREMCWSSFKCNLDYILLLKQCVEFVCVSLNILRSSSALPLKTRGKE